jgi:hypothetical protein
MAEGSPKKSDAATDEEIATSVLVDPDNAPVHPAAFRQPFSKDMESLNDKRGIARRCARSMEIYAEMVKERIDLVKSPKELDYILDYMNHSKNLMYRAIEKLPERTPQSEMEKWLKRRKTSHTPASSSGASSS